MRVLLVNKFHYLKGGAETYDFALADGLASAGHEVARFSMMHPKNVACVQERYFVTEREYNGGSPVSKVRDGLALIYSGEAKRKFQALCEDFRPDVVHMSNVHRQITLSILDAVYLAEHRVPVVWTAHDYISVCPAYTMVNGAGKVCDACLDGRFRHCVERRCVKGSRAKSALAAAEAAFLRAHGSYGKVDRIVCPSRFMKSVLDGAGYAEKTVYLQNFLTEAQRLMGERVSVAAGEKFSAPEPYFLFFGRLSDVKGVPTLVKAFARALPELGAGWRLLIAGDGPERGDIERLAAESCAGDRVELLGYRTGEDLQRLVGGARFTVMPSEWRENMPYSGLESLAAGTPVVGARIGGIPEIVVEGETGLGFEPGDIAGLADALVHAAAVPEAEYVRMQKACSAYVRERCDQGRYVVRVVETYKGLIKGMLC